MYKAGDIDKEINLYANAMPADFHPSKFSFVSKVALPQGFPKLDFLGSGDAEKNGTLLKVWRELEPLQGKFRNHIALVKAQELNDQGKSNANVSAMEGLITQHLEKHEHWYQLCRGLTGTSQDVQIDMQQARQKLFSDAAAPSVPSVSERAGASGVSGAAGASPVLLWWMLPCMGSSCSTHLDTVPGILAKRLAEDDGYKMSMACVFLPVQVMSGQGNGVSNLQAYHKEAQTHRDKWAHIISTHQDLHVVPIMGMMDATSLDSKDQPIPVFALAVFSAKCLEAGGINNVWAQGPVIQRRGFHTMFNAFPKSQFINWTEPLGLGATPRPFTTTQKQHQWYSGKPMLSACLRELMDVHALKSWAVVVLEDYTLFDDQLMLTIMEINGRGLAQASATERHCVPNMKVAYLAAPFGTDGKSERNTIKDNVFNSWCENFRIMLRQGQYNLHPISENVRAAAMDPSGASGASGDSGASIPLDVEPFTIARPSACRKCLQLTQDCLDILAGLDGASFQKPGEESVIITSQTLIDTHNAEFNPSGRPWSLKRGREEPAFTTIWPNLELQPTDPNLPDLTKDHAQLHKVQSQGSVTYYVDKQGDIFSRGNADDEITPDNPAFMINGKFHVGSEAGSIMQQDSWFLFLLLCLWEYDRQSEF